MGAAAVSEIGGPPRSLLMEEGAARILASSHDSHPQNRAAANNMQMQKRINNNKAPKPDTRLSRDALPGEIKFKQIKLTNKKTNFDVILLIRKIQ